MTSSVRDSEAIEGKREKRMNKRGAAALTIYTLLYTFAQIQSDNNKQSLLANTLRINETWNFYQSKNIRQSVYSMAHDDLSNMALVTEDPRLRDKIQKRLAYYQSNIERYESDPVTGEGKQELAVRARGYEEALNRGKAKAPIFDYAITVLQMAIVFGSSAILAISMPMLVMSIGSAAIGAGLIAYLMSH